MATQTAGRNSKLNFMAYLLAVSALLSGCGSKLPDDSASTTANQTAVASGSVNGLLPTNYLNPAPSTNGVPPLTSTVPPITISNSSPPSTVSAPPPQTGIVPSSVHAVFRSFGPTNGDFLFTLSVNEGPQAGFIAQGIPFNLFDDGGGTRVALYRCYNPNDGRHFVSTMANCEGLTVDGSLGYIQTAAVPEASRPLFRCFSNQGAHLETLAANECVAAGFSVELVTGYVP